jgi:hypothetical protein
MDDPRPTSSALPPLETALPAPDPAAARREHERARRAEAARIAALVQHLLHDRGEAAKD